MPDFTKPDPDRTPNEPAGSSVPGYQEGAGQVPDAGYATPGGAQDPVGQPPTGSPYGPPSDAQQYGQAQYGQAQYGQQQYGQQQHDQPEHGQQQYGEPTYGVQGPQPGYAPQPGQGYGPAYGPGGYAPAGPPPDNYLVWAILTTLFCFWPTGIVAIVKSANVNSRWAVGDVQGAMEASASAKNWSKWTAIIAIGVFALVFLVYVLLFVVVGGAALLDSSTP